MIKLNRLLKTADYSTKKLKIQESSQSWLLRVADLCYQNGSCSIIDGFETINDEMNMTKDTISTPIYTYN